MVIADIETAQAIHDEAKAWVQENKHVLAYDNISYIDVVMAVTEYISNQQGYTIFASKVS